MFVICLAASTSFAFAQGRVSLALGYQAWNNLEAIDLYNSRATGYHLNLGYHRWISEEKATRIFFVNSSVTSQIMPRGLGSTREIVAGSNYRYTYSGLEIQRKYLVTGEADDPNVWYYGWGFGVTSGTLTTTYNYLDNGSIPSTETTQEKHYDLYPMGFVGYEMPIQGRFIGFAELTLSASISDILFFVPKLGVSYRLY